MAKMNSEIVFKEITDGNVSSCRDLCNALMKHQADNGIIHAEVLQAMNFENRLKPSFEHSNEKQLIVAYDGEIPVGYVFSSAENETEEARTMIPSWATALSGADKIGMYPDWLILPNKIGCLNNLYVMPAYRGRHIAAALCDQAMRWLTQLEAVAYLYVYISNGNDEVIDFYKQYGFAYSHDVFGGFIKAYYQKV
ncbi:GNAT family N-acetyltransferase [Fusibacter paucivorans]|uniref:GNAT family N-acetyltransferase n=1 Tax=Fusibacter paucivorans TaxID=76009 RepID=A0ABS5PKM5_9FIRM|nr:GNAT family N-acetyltransferase [Fusibacter paucivorans]MBS7525658.1 GNAT family N-acetyltransferase [Fusibacter paucivorans]